ncbi:hypothetical protein ACC817_28590 [Rhizobium ruizarguesonis]
MASKNKAARRMVIPAFIGLMGALVSIPADAKQETFWIEKVAIIAVGQGVCGMPLADGDAMQTSIGSALITLAISKDAVIERARKRAHFIAADLQKHRSQSTFCQAFSYYVQNGYPR